VDLSGLVGMEWSIYFTNEPQNLLARFSLRLIAFLIRFRAPNRATPSFLPARNHLYKTLPQTLPLALFLATIKRTEDTTPYWRSRRSPE
jgi:hypothetical protein